MVEVNVTVTLGLACERMLFGGAGIAKLGESAICPAPAQPSAESVRVERAKCRRALATL